MIDLWSGLGGTLIALLALGIRCIALSAEMDINLHQALASAFPNLVMISKVEDISAEHFAAVIKRRDFSSILVGGGSPCQGNSSLNSSRQGMGDCRSNQPQLLHRLVGDLRAMTKVPVLAFLENVASAPSEVVEAYSHWVGGAPIRISAHDWGWVHRSRLFWLSGPLGDLHQLDNPDLPQDMAVVKAPRSRT